MRIAAAALLAALSLGLSATVQAAPVTVGNSEIEVYFSPNGGALDAILRNLGAAQKSVHMQAFHFRSEPIVKALQAAAKRGLDVRVIVDAESAAKSNSRAGQAAQGGVPVFTDAEHAVSHNKIIVIDGATVITGSYNFVKRAEYKNAENMLVIRSAELAAKYEENWERHFAHSKPFK